MMVLINPKDGSVGESEQPQRSAELAILSQVDQRHSGFRTSDALRNLLHHYCLWFRTHSLPDSSDIDLYAQSTDCHVRLAIGPLCLVPTSEILGRRNVYLTSFLLSTTLNAGCATSPNIVASSVLRLAAGTCASAGPTLGGATVSDMFSKEKRGKAQALYALGPALGLIIGPLIGAFVVDRTHSWRWLLWILAIASGVVTLGSTVFLKETYTPFLIGPQKSEKLGNAVSIVGF